MKKRLISLIMSAVMIISMNITLPVSAASEKFDNAMEFAKRINLFNETAEGTTELSRGQMARIICSMLDMMPDTAGEWYDNTFKDSNSDVLLESLSSGLKFEDVQATDEFYSYIKTVTDRGIMVGVSETQFMPDSPMTYMQFLKVILCMMGYRDMAEMQGGYPSGYISVAGNIGFKEINGKDYNEHITLEEAAYIVHENLDTPIASVEYNGGEDWQISYGDKYFGEKILGIYTYKNRVNAIGKLNLYDDREYAEDSVLIGETLFKVSPDYNFDEELFAREVTVYYLEDDGDIGTIIFAELTGTDNAVTFDLDKLEEFEGDRLTYLDGARIRTLKLKIGAYFVQNGEMISKYNKESFDYDYGKITLIQSKDENVYDVIIVDGYNSIYVSGIDNTKQIIYSANAEQIELSEEKENYKITKNGEGKIFSDIQTEGIIDVSESEKRTNVVIPDKSKVITVNSSGTDDNGKYIITKENEKLGFAKSYVSSNSFVSPKVGVEYTVLLNGNGDIAWIETGTVGGQIGYFLKAAKNDENETPLVKLLKEDGKTELFVCNEKLVICDENNIEHKNISSDNFIGYFLNDDGSDYKGLLRYTLDDEGKIKKIELPITNPEVDEEGKFYDLKAMNGYGDVTGHLTGNTWGGMMFLSDSYTKAVFVPSPEGDDSKHVVAKYGEIPTGNSIKAEFYGFKPNSLEVEYMISTQAYEAGYKMPKNFKNWAVLKSRTIAYDEVSGMVVDKITAVTIQTNDFDTINEIEFTAPHEYTNENGEACSILDLAYDVGQSKDENGENRTYSLNPGDIFYYSADTFNKLTGISLMYKADMKNPYAVKQEKLGWLAGTYDDYRTGNDTEKKYSNPYSLSSSQLLATGLSYICDAIRIHKVSPYSKDANTYLSTSMDLNTYNWKDAELKIEDNYKSHYLEGKRYPVFGYPYPSRGTTITLLENGKIDVKAFTKSDMKTADIYGKDCSTVIQFLSWSNSVGIIVINDER